MKFTIPFNMNAFLFAAGNQIKKPEPGAFVWGYRNHSPLVFIGNYKAYTQTQDRSFYTIDLLDGGYIDVDGIVSIPDQLLPYVVDRDNNVYRVQSVGCNTIVTTHGHEFKYNEVQPVLYHSHGPKAPSDAMAEKSKEPELPNRIREEGV